jgi:hypothetical protein
VPLRDDWNYPLASAEDDCSAQIFYYPQNKEGIETHIKFLKSLNTNWNALSSDIEALLIEGEYGKFGLSIGIVKNAFEVPELETMDAFFNSASSYKTGSKIMVVVISSFDECKLKY